ncbi:uncharacterized protein LOC131227718 [Magnolia sinica]|uniref:uncharacterized protein LOC131227718 n=1 Tax=Magnolia sinica TaxID=86752 RepID=UPI002658BEEB|nr:uncharacterized protein LOC131227718 [Magnolia sinica]
MERVHTRIPKAPRAQRTCIHFPNLPLPRTQNLQSPSSYPHSTPPLHQKLQNPPSPSSHHHTIHDPTSNLVIRLSQLHTCEKKELGPGPGPFKSPSYRVESSSDKELRGEKNEGSIRDIVRPSPPQAESLIRSRQSKRLGPRQKKARKELSISISLSREEIASDFLEMGMKLPRQPKKRPKNVQKSLDRLYPGTGLFNITPDSYDIPR